VIWSDKAEPAFAIYLKIMSQLAAGTTPAGTAVDGMNYIPTDHLPSSLQAFRVVPAVQELVRKLI
jgi:hypothetical protein